jgi:hypothetical protein
MSPTPCRAGLDVLRRLQCTYLGCTERQGAQMKANGTWDTVHKHPPMLHLNSPIHVSGIPYNPVLLIEADDLREVLWQGLHTCLENAFRAAGSVQSGDSPS